MMNLNLEQFLLRHGVLHGVDCTLVNPQHVGCDWTTDTLKYRSSIWGQDGQLLSAGFPKFFNLGEKPALYPPLEGSCGWECVEKIDGSCLIASQVNGQPVFRTRGSFDARHMENGYEIDTLLAKYPNILHYLSPHFSLIFEWVSPTNQIVIRHPEPDLYLIGLVYHEDYTLSSQSQLDSLAKHFGTPRPKRYQFLTIEDMVSTVKAFDGVEGICTYYNGGQNIVKIKSAKYLQLHAFRSNCTENSIIDLFLAQGYYHDGLLWLPNTSTILQYIESNFDFECRMQAQSVVEKIGVAASNLNREMRKYLYSIFPQSDKITRKDFAKLVTQHVSQISPLAYMRLDNKVISAEVAKRVLLRFVK